MHERKIVFAAVCVAWLAAAEGRAEVVELATLEKRALEKHALLTAGSLRERAAAAEVRQAESAYRPHVGMNVEATAAPGRVLQQLPRSDKDGDGLPDANDGIYVQGARPVTGPGRSLSALKPRPRAGAGVEVAANLYDFGRTEAAVSAGRAKLRAAEAEQAVSRTQIIQGVRAQYLAWLTAHELHRIALTASDDAARRRERIASLISEGARPRTDLPPIDAERLLSELERERAEGDLRSAQLALEQTVGQPLATDAAPDTRLIAEPAAAGEGPRLPDPSLRLLAHQRNALTATARWQRKQRAPLLAGSLGAGLYGQQSNDADGRLNFSVFPTYSAGLTLTIPLWDGGESAAGAEAAEARANELGVRLESAERSQQQELERARLDAEHAKKRQAVAQQLLDVCKTRVSDADAGYELGAMQFDQVQQARALLRRAETELVLAKIAHAEAVLRVAP